MDLSPLWEQKFPIPHHAIMAMSAILIGGLQMIAPKGTLIHKIMGYIWALLMAGTAISALFIYDFRVWGPFSPIHLLSPVILFFLGYAIHAARQGNIKRHSKTMTYLYFLGLILTALFTLLPGRTMHMVLFGGSI